MPLELTVHAFEPVYDKNSRILILGTMPSPVSRKNGFYYTHPQNRFWKVLAAVFNEDEPLSVADKKSFVLRHRIALWDVLESCMMEGAGDSTIREPKANNLNLIFSKCRIAGVFTTGSQAYRLYMKLCSTDTGRDAVSLPSTSPANRWRWPFENLVEAYSVIKNFL